MDAVADDHDGRFLEFDDEKAKQKREAMCIDLNGGYFDITKLSPKELADNVEMLIPLIRPYGCAPVAPSDDIVLRTYDRILEVRNETRFTELGLAIGDRTFKRCYQQALREIARYELASDSLKKDADNGKFKGVRYVFNGTGTHAGIKYPLLRKANEKEVADGVLRKPNYAVQKAFECIMDKHWHRYMFPFGCFFYSNPCQNHAGWKEWAGSILDGRPAVDVRTGESPTQR